MKPAVEQTGKKYGRLLVTDRVGVNKHKQITWLCECDCGNKIITTSSSLKSGHTTSCGCYARELFSKNFTTHGLSRDETGKQTRLYGIWKCMVGRCHRPGASGYERYGEHGIIVCPHWHDYKNFYDWAMQNGYRHDLTIDRINNKGNYDPLNCRWATNTQQQRNRGSNRMVDFNGQSEPMVVWSEKYHVNYATLKSRLNAGWPVEKALLTPTKQI